MDGSTPKAQPGAPGISIRNGPVHGDAMDVDQPNGLAKRKSRSSISKNVSYKDESDSEEGAPLVGAISCLPPGNTVVLLFQTRPFLTQISGQTPQDCCQG